MMNNKTGNTTGALYIVATPIGNLGDITYRAVEVLSSVDRILAEDTRVTRVLTERYEIRTTVQTYNAHMSDSAHDAVVADLSDGKDIALVSDAGTPGISDPGVRLVNLARDAGIPVVAVPGASSVTAALSISGAVGNTWTFLGFIPHKKGRQTFFKQVANTPHTVVFLEAVHRIEKTLESLKETLHEGRKIGIARELTKLHEEYVYGTPEEVIVYFSEHKDHLRGEFVVVVYPA